ncbi:uncharacterized protein ARMOST_19305 [Armillaria ostoyae]|uniref:Uncharacterized protein n=1 Tax=Armillaria ostoyae TaxID=47428 RepID=A0A284S462_ARMOS|nr:uncharacterized protein ARMOST_19305 [Armillaria ostoyae]
MLFHHLLPSYADASPLSQTNGIGGYPATNPFHTTYPYVTSDTNVFGTSIVQYLKDTYPQESHEATASSQLESDVSSVPTQSQAPYPHKKHYPWVPESVEERLSPEYPFLFMTHSLIKKRNSHKPCIQESSKPPSDKPYEVKICSPPQDRKQIPEALGQVKYKFWTPGLSLYNRHLIWFKDPTVPSDTPGVSMSQILKGDRGCIDMSDLVPHELPGNSCYIDVVFRAPGYQPQYIRILIDCCHAKLKHQKIRPTYYNLAYVISEGYKKILQVEGS